VRIMVEMGGVGWGGVKVEWHLWWGRHVQARLTGSFQRHARTHKHTRAHTHTLLHTFK